MIQVVLVTGGSGFIGAWVLRELIARGAEPIVVDTQPPPPRWQRLLGHKADRVSTANVSLLDRDGLARLLDARGVTQVIHLAALLTPACQSDPWLGCQVNVLGSTALFDAARRSGRIKNISYASSYAVYGSEAPSEVAGGSAPLGPPTFYGAFKQSVDLIAEQYARHFGISSTAIRPHVVYGPERDQGLTAGPSLACRAAALGESYEIGYTGLVGYDYVEDVARAFVQAAFESPLEPAARVVDLPGEQATTEQFAETIERVVPEARGRIRVNGPAIPCNIPAQPRYISTLFPDWRPTPLADGIRRTVAFYRQKERV